MKQKNFFDTWKKKYDFLIGCHSNFNFECNTERGFIKSLSIALGESHWQKDRMVTHILSYILAKSQILIISLYVLVNHRKKRLPLLKSFQCTGCKSLR